MDLRPAESWQPPEGWTRITTLDAHAGGEPLRVVLAGFPEPPGPSILARRAFLKAELDHLRHLLMWEPRGHSDMYGCLLVPPTHPQVQLGVLFMHNEGYSTMCGHGILAVVKVALETGLVSRLEPETHLGLETPAGVVEARAEVNGGAVGRIAFRNVPSFVLALDQVVDVRGLGPVRYDLAFGGAFYAFVEAASVGLACRPRDYRRLIETGMAVKRAIMDSVTIEHPTEPELGFLYGTIFTGPPPGDAGSQEGGAPEEGVHSRHVCVFAEGQVDRCPTGTGVSARLAIRRARGEIEPGQPMVVESIIGSCFTGRILEETQVGPHAAVVPEVEGTAHLTGRHELWVDPDDPLQPGFLLR